MLRTAEVRSTDTPKPAPDVPVSAALEPVHCRKCKRMLFRATAKALRAGEMVETKCGKCGALNYLLGASEIVVDNE